MTTGQEVFDRAMRLLGYTDIYGQADSLQYADLYKRGLPVVNQIYSDLWWAGHAAGRGGMRREVFSELTALEQPLELTPRCIADIAPYGVAMLLAQGMGDGDNQALFASLYGQKRACGVQDGVAPGRAAVKEGAPCGMTSWRGTGGRVSTCRGWTAAGIRGTRPG